MYGLSRNRPFSCFSSASLLRTHRPRRGRAPQRSSRAPRVDAALLANHRERGTPNRRAPGDEDGCVEDRCNLPERDGRLPLRSTVGAHCNAPPVEEASGAVRPRCTTCAKRATAASACATTWATSAAADAAWANASTTLPRPGPSATPGGERNVGASLARSGMDGGWEGRNRQRQRPPGGLAPKVRTKRATGPGDERAPERRCRAPERRCRATMPRRGGGNSALCA